MSPDVSLRLEKVKIVGRAKGAKTWMLKAKRVDVALSKTTTTLYDLYDGVIYDNGKQAAKVKAGRAFVNDIDKSLEVTDGVTVTAKGDLKVTTKNARYDSWRKLLTCPNKVSMISGKSIASADSMVTDIGTGEVDAKHLQMKVEANEIESILLNSQP